MRFIKHLSNLIGNIFGFAKENEAWWLIPVFFVLLLLALLLVVGKVAAPYIYTLF